MTTNMFTNTFEQAVQQHVGRRIKNIRVVQFIVQDTAPYKPQVIRPFKTTADEGMVQNIVTVVGDDLARAGATNTISMNKAASGFIQISQTHEALSNIPNGWHERRMRFILVAEIENVTGTITKTYINGYTSHAGITPSGAVDPSMLFIINNVIETNVYMTNTPYGPMPKEVVSSSVQVVNGVLMKDLVMPTAQPMYMGQQQQGLFTLRPSDVLLGMEANRLASALNTEGYAYNHFNDTRLNADQKTYIKNTRTNNVPLQYLTDIVNNYHKAISLTDDFNQSPESATMQAYNMSGGSDFEDNLLLKMIAKNQGAINTTMFTLPELERVAPNASQVLQYFRFSEMTRVSYNPVAESEDMTAATMETSIATLLAQSIPALMSRQFMSKVHFSTTNQIIGVEVPQTVILNAESFINIDLVPMMETFKYRLKTEVLDYMSYNNQIPYEIDMNCNMFGDTVISIRISTIEPIRYVIPSFCDNLFTPVMTINRDNLNVMSSDISHVLSRVESVNWNNMPIPAY